MNTPIIHDEILNQDGEVTEVSAPVDFGNDLSFLNPADMPDLETAEIGFNIQPESIEFKTVGDSIRAVFNGFTTFQVKDKVNKGGYLPKRTAVLQTKTGIKINMGANLVKQLELVPVGTAIQITYKGEQKTNSGNEVKVYEVITLNVPRVNIPAIHNQPQLTQPAPVEKKPQFKNAFLSTDYWNKANELRFTRQEGLDHLAECGNDFEEAIARLTGELPM